MDRSNTSQDLEKLRQQLGAMTATVMADKAIPAADMRTVLRFISKVALVVEQAFGDVYACLVDVRLLRNEDLKTNRVVKIQRALALLTVRSRYRDAEEICSRLHYLSEEYIHTVQPIVAGVEDQQAWSQVFYLLNEYEGRIIFMVANAIGELEGMLDSDLTPGNLPAIKKAAGGRAEEVRAVLGELGDLRNRILGISGGVGLLELVSSDDRDQAAAAIIMEEVRMGDSYTVHGAGAVGPGATARDVTINQAWNTLDSQDTTALARDLDVLRAELRRQSSQPEHDLATAEVAAAQIAAQEGDGPTALAHLAKAGKWAFGIATSIGTTIAAAAIKAALGI